MRVVDPIGWCVVRRRVVAPAVDGLEPLDVVGPHEVLPIATLLLDGEIGYEVELVGERTGLAFWQRARATLSVTA